MTAAYLAAIFVIAAGYTFGLLAFASAAISTAALSGAALAAAIFALARLGSKIEDLRAITILERNLGASGIEAPDLYFGGAAADGSLALLLLKVVRLTKPRRILEFGAGQSTMPMAAAARQYGGSVTSVESNPKWAEEVNKALSPMQSESKVMFSPLGPTRVNDQKTGRALQINWHQSIEGIVTDRYELILVDGPASGGRNARMGVLNCLPEALADEFVVVIDDANRQGESALARAVRASLRRHDIEHVSWQVFGLKTQVVIASKSLGFLRGV